MNIAFVVSSLTNGGAERCVANLANQMSFGEENRIFVITGERKEHEYELRDSVVRLCAITYKHFFQDFFHIRRIAREYKIDVFIAFDVYPNALLCFTNIFFKPKVIISERNAPGSVKISVMARLVRFLLYRNANGYVFQTEGAKSFYSAKIQRKSTVIHNPIKEDLPTRSIKPYNEIVAVGRLVPQKNYQMLLDAFSHVHALYPQYTLRIFGQGNLLSDLQKYAQERQIDNFVFFEGFCTDVHEQIKNADIFVMTSNYEGMPNALMEAMAMGFPVISTDCPAGGPRELIDGKNGLLVPVGDVNAFSNAILKILHDPILKYNLCVNAKNIMETHTCAYITDQWFSFIHNVIQSNL